jgi:hypothetical protein
MVDPMHNIVLWAIRALVLKTTYILASSDKVIIIDNHIWLNVHVYGMKNQKGILIPYK